MDELYVKSVRLINNFLSKISHKDIGLMNNLLVKINNSTVNYIDSWYLIDDIDFRNLLVHGILFDDHLSNYDCYS